MIDADGPQRAVDRAGLRPQAGHACGENWAAQGNMLAADRAWHAMGEAFE